MPSAVTCPALAALFAHVGIVSKEDSHGLQVPQRHGQLQRGAPSGVLLFNVVLREMVQLRRDKKTTEQGLESLKEISKADRRWKWQRMALQGWGGSRWVGLAHLFCALLASELGARWWGLVRQR